MLFNVFMSNEIALTSLILTFIVTLLLTNKMKRSLNNICFAQYDVKFYY